ncbi:hypothetical protein PUR49_08200 [Streptomyces sp. BE147]|uniref:hypothetical protein n=1 Tax=Streptomyces sp. BE147 TaxID=3002524 RepID=UPI002E777848|nr:hypothetical protein [Streptomyces sp. BE147]MEE1736480.1 hypothetical protein [Streptomyces sp. BE147]
MTGEPTPATYTVSMPGRLYAHLMETDAMDNPAPQDQAARAALDTARANSTTGCCCCISVRAEADVLHHIGEYLESLVSLMTELAVPVGLSSTALTSVAERFKEAAA